MATNYLEQLVAEWYEYRGYFVRRNILVGKRAKGGYECELDIVAFHPEARHLVQVEPSMDTDSWSIRERRYTRKFDAGRKYIPEIFRGLTIPNEIEQIAVLVFASKASHKDLGGGKLVLVDELLAEIFQELKDKHLSSSAIPEHLIVLRSFQFIAEYKKTVLNVLNKAD